MIVRKNLKFSVIIKRTWKRSLSLILVALIVSVGHAQFGITHVAISSLPASILGIAIALLVSFRVNSAYERWWEARKIWGALVNDSRTFARQITTFFTLQRNPNGTLEEVFRLKKEMIYRHLAFIYALKNHLRKVDILPELAPFISQEEIEDLRGQKNIPNAILQKQGIRLAEIQQLGYIEDFRHMQMDTKISALCDSMGASERIKNTIFPRQYSFYSTYFVKLYSYLLPFILVNEMMYLTIPATFIIGFIFYGLDTIANGVENPFDNTVNDTPMSSLARTIEINLRQVLGETELPAPVEPVDGFLF